jgi:hypothetical protein
MKSSPALFAARRAIPLCLVSLVTLVWTGCIGDAGITQADSSVPGEVSTGAVVQGRALEASKEAALQQASTKVGAFDDCTINLRMFVSGGYVFSAADVLCKTKHNYNYLDTYAFKPNTQVIEWDHNSCFDQKWCQAMARIKYAGKGKYKAHINVLIASQTWFKKDIYHDF